MEDTGSQKQSPFIYRFRNIGPVKDAELELGDLTIIAGRNNTGKTYIVYTLYGFLKMWETWPHAERFLLRHKGSEDDFPNLQRVAEQLIRDGRASFSLNREAINKQRAAVVRELTRDFSEQAMSDVFSSQNGTFEESSIEVLCNDDKSDILELKSEVAKGVFLSINYNGDYAVVAIDRERDRLPLHELLSCVSYFYIRFLLIDRLPDPFILSAERFGISLFYRELDFTKNQLVDVLQKIGDDKNRDRISPYLLIDRTTSRYALPIKDNIDYTRSIPDLRGRKSEIYDDKLFDDIKDMMNGYYGNSGDDIRFISKGRGKGRRFNIPLHLASSSARGLSDFYFFLRHVARTNHLLIIDEPESHLDTANQIQLARLLARFVHAGLKVLITTHSDYLIKEINNLVMLSRPFTDKASVIKKLKYGKDDFLEPELIRAYVAEKNGLTRCVVDHFGIDMPVFDKTIDGINKVANELSSRLMDDAEA